MTPLIREVIAFAPSPESFMWFDVGVLDWVDHTKVPADVIMHPPFKRTAMCMIDKNRVKMAVCLIAGDNNVTVAGYAINPFRVFQVFSYLHTGDGIRFYMKDKEVTLETLKPAMRMVMAALLRINEGALAYEPKPTNSLINRKRAAKGKPPLTFDWHTITIEPPAPKSDPQGGTHASPRLHDRRGHWRKMKSGKTVWVKECKVGDASRGVVFKDYQVTEGVVA